MVDNDLKDIDPEIIEAVRTHAESFIAVGKSIDEVISWGEAELDTAEKLIAKKGGTVQDFKKIAGHIEGIVREKLKGLEDGVRATYPSPQSGA